MALQRERSGGQESGAAKTSEKAGSEGGQARCAGSP
jgi:hypothetical protein